MGSLHGFYLTVLRKSFYIHWSAGRSPWVHEVNPGRDPSGRDKRDSVTIIQEGSGDNVGGAGLHSQIQCYITHTKCCFVIIIE